MRGLTILTGLNMLLFGDKDAKRRRGKHILCEVFY